MFNLFKKRKSAISHILPAKLPESAPKSQTSLNVTINGKDAFFTVTCNEGDEETLADLLYGLHKGQFSHTIGTAVSKLPKTQSELVENRLIEHIQLSVNSVEERIAEYESNEPIISPLVALNYLMSGGKSNQLQDE